MPSPASGCVSTLSCASGAPATRLVPAASVTCTSVAPSSVEIASLKVSVSCAGSASTVESAAGIRRDQLVVRARRRRDEQATGGQEQRGGRGGDEADEGTWGEVCQASDQATPSTAVSECRM